jgi:hypothetical protein
MKNLSQGSRSAEPPEHDAGVPTTQPQHLVCIKSTHLA